MACRWKPAMKPLPMIPIRSGAVPGALIAYFPSCLQPARPARRHRLPDRHRRNNQVDPDGLTSLAELHHWKTQTGRARFVITQIWVTPALKNGNDCQRDSSAEGGLIRAFLISLGWARWHLTGWS